MFLIVAGNVAKIAWEKLRRCFTNAVNRRRAKQAKLGNKSNRLLHPWKYEKRMSFLIPFTEHRKQCLLDDSELFDGSNEATFDACDGVSRLEDQKDDRPFSVAYELPNDTMKSSITIKREVSDSPERELAVRTSESFDLDLFKKDRNNDLSAALCTDLGSDNSSGAVNWTTKDLLRNGLILNKSASSTKRMPQNRYDSKTESSNLRESLLNSGNNLLSITHNTNASGFVHGKGPELDDTDLFFLSMGKTIKKLPRMDQAKIKLLLSNAVFQAQINYLDLDSNRNSPLASSSTFGDNENFEGNNN